jgi:hypothetical protein
MRQAIRLDPLYAAVEMIDGSQPPRDVDLLVVGLTHYRSVAMPRKRR